MVEQIQDNRASKTVCCLPVLLNERKNVYVERSEILDVFYGKDAVFTLSLVLDSVSSWSSRCRGKCPDVRETLRTFAGTIANGAALLHQEGAREVYACCTHAVFR